MAISTSGVRSVAWIASGMAIITANPEAKLKKSLYELFRTILIVPVTVWLTIHVENSA